MVTRRIRKKWLKKEFSRVADELIDAVERVSGKEVLNMRGVGKAADDFLHGEIGEVDEVEERDNFKNFTMMPLRLQDTEDSVLHIVFEIWPLTVTFRSDKGILDLAALGREFESRCCPHPHTQVRFREVDYREMKRELVGKLNMRLPVGPDHR